MGSRAKDVPLALPSPHLMMKAAAGGGPEWKHQKQGVANCGRWVKSNHHLLLWINFYGNTAPPNLFTYYLWLLSLHKGRVKKLPQILCLCMLSHFCHVWLFATLWIVTHQAPLSMGFSKQEYWSGLPCPPPGDFPNPGIEHTSLVLPALAGGFFTTSATWEALRMAYKA